jgi:hypothetical protein
MCTAEASQGRRSLFIGASDTFEAHALADPFWASEALSRGLNEHLFRSWHTTIQEVDAEVLSRILPRDAKLLLRQTLTRKRQMTAVYQFAGCLVDFWVAAGETWVAVAGPSLAEAQAVLDFLEPLFPPPVEEVNEREVPVVICGRTMHTMHRTIDVDPWDEIAAGYADSAREQVSKLVASREPAGSGRLILWWGMPGVGKSYAVRALAHAWRDWCATVIITDPECYLEDPHYLLDVAQGGAGSREHVLVVMEDAGALLEKDAKAATGQRFAKLLNVSDGILSEGMRAYFLLTTNEKITSLHPAVSRPGRCLAKTEFSPLPVELARASLENHDAAEAAAGIETPITLAEAWAIRRGEIVVPERRPVGFAAST